MSSRSDGSAQFQQGAKQKSRFASGELNVGEGPVTVLAGISGPLEVRLRDEIPDRAHLEVNVRPARGLPGMTPNCLPRARLIAMTGPSTKALAETLSSLLLPLLLLQRYPRSLIQLTLQTLALPSTKFSKPFRTYTEEQDEDEEVEQESMSEKAAAINASVCALMDAGVAMKGMICAVALAIIPPSADEESMNVDNVQVVLDPTAEEERASQCTMCLAFSFGEANGGQAGDMCFIETGKGGCSEEEVSDHIWSR